MEYGINTSNKFAFLGGDEDVHDPAEILARAELDREKAKAASHKTAVKKPVVPVAVEKKVTIAPSANKENVDARRNQPRRDQPPRGPPGAGGGFERKDRGPRGPPRPNNENSTAPNPGDAMSERFGENRPPRQPRGQNFERRNNAGGDGQNRGSFGRGGGNEGGWQRTGGDHGGPRGGGPRMPRNENSTGGDNTVPLDMDGQPFNRPPNNLGRAARGPRNGPGPKADRISGSDKTGIRSVPKKDGFGKGNWGTEKDELVAETDPIVEGDLNKSTDAAALENNNTNDNPEHIDGQDDVEPEEKIRELTLEEWKAQQKSQKPNFNVRKAGEGGNEKVYQKLVLVKPQGKDDDTAEEEDEANQIKREPREKPLNIEVSFSDSQRNRGGYREERGGGGYRGGEDRGGRGGGGGNFERGDNRRSGGQGGGRGGFGGGRRSNYSDAGEPGGSGTGRRPQHSGGFKITEESFPALGASSTAG